MYRTFGSYPWPLCGICTAKTPIFVRAKFCLTRAVYLSHFVTTCKSDQTDIQTQPDEVVCCPNIIFVCERDSLGRRRRDYSQRHMEILETTPKERVYEWLV